jgi:hypothetical protein
VYCCDGGCEDGIFRVIVCNGYDDADQNPINICVILILDEAGHHNFPGRTCYPKLEGVDRYYLDAGTVSSRQRVYTPNQTMVHSHGISPLSLDHHDGPVKSLSRITFGNPL